MGTYVRFNVPQELQYLSFPRSLELDADGELITESHKKIHFLKYFESEFDKALFFNSDLESSSDAIKTIRRYIDETFKKTVEEIRLNTHLIAATNIEDIRLNPSINVYKKETGYLIENLFLEFKIDGAWMPWSYLSDGTKRSFYLIAEVANAQNSLILIEEPEIGIHPFQLHKVMTFLKEQSATKQIILSTHSPEVLNILEPDELDQVLIASIRKGVTSFHRLSEAQKEKARMFMTEVGDLSDYWLHSDLEQVEEHEDASHD